MARLRAWLGDAAAVSEILDAGAHAASVHAAVISRARVLADQWPTLSPHDATRSLRALVTRVTIRPDTVTLAIDGGRVSRAEQN